MHSAAAAAAAAMCAFPHVYVAFQTSQSTEQKRDAGHSSRTLPFPETSQDGDGGGHTGLVHIHLLESALKRRVLLNVLAVLIKRCGTNASQLASSQHGLQQITWSQAKYSQHDQTCPQNQQMTVHTSTACPSRPTPGTFWDPNF